MTTRNFRVNNGISVGDVAISATTNKITGLSTSAPTADGDSANKKYVDDQIAALSFATIGTGNTSITVTDSGTGSIATVVDGTTILTSTSALSTFAGSVRINGDLTLAGTNTIINTTTLSVEDNIIEVNRNMSAASGMPIFSGLKVNRGEVSSATEQDLFWVWDESFADDASTIYAGAGGGAWTALRATGTNDPTALSSTDATLVDIRCRIVNATATSAQYADIAERFAADAPMTEGAVVMLGGAQEITETSEDLSEQVFGVISSKPAYMMNSGAGNNESHPFVAMTGRTHVRVIGAVNKGDRIVSSSVKGTARAAKTGESINPFHVIGRALEGKSDTGIGMVNCFVQAKN
jgi:hypothetical protein